jgi:hypothetical protein
MRQCQGPPAERLPPRCAHIDIKFFLQGLKPPYAAVNAGAEAPAS